MPDPTPQSASGDPDVNAFGTAVHLDGDEWCVTVIADGQRRVVSRHATEEQAHEASGGLNSSANRQEVPTGE